MSRPIDRKVGGWRRARVGAAAAAIAATAAFTVPARAAEVTYGFRGDDASIMVAGEIQPGDAMKVSDMMGAVARSGHRLAVVALNSQGGKVADAVVIADMVRTQGLSTYIPPGGECASSCFMIFAAGRSKVVGPFVMVGIHSASETVMEKGPSDGRPIPVVAMTPNSRAVTTEVAGYVRNLGVPTYLSTRMAATPTNSIYWLTNDDLRAMGVAFVPAPGATG